MSARTFLASPRFWVETAERAVKSAAQGAILAVGADQLDVLALDWRVFAGSAAGGALLSVLTSLVSGTTGGDTPSLVD